jgi:hypothetical protein
LVERSFAGVAALGVLDPHPRWSNWTIR